MSWHTCQSFFSNLLLVFLLTTAYLEARFYKVDCELWSSYNVDTVYINNDNRKIVLELTNGSTLVVPFDFGFREFQITTGRGYERTYIYNGKTLIRTRSRECVEAI